jgi:exosortase
MMASASRAPRMTARHGCFIALLIAAAALFRAHLATLANLVFESQRYSYIAFIPIISASLLYLERNSIFPASRPSRLLGPALYLAGSGVLWVLGTNSQPTLAALSLVVLWAGAFLLCYGEGAAKAAAFPLLFLLLTVPPPAAWMERLVVWLQSASADVSYLLFKLTGVPVLRQNFVFSLPGLDIEVAEQCSGIRSTVSLLIASVVAGHLVLNSTWKKVCLSLFAIPIVIAKNALRIVVLSLWGAYVDRDILFGRIHKTSGLLFSPLAFLALGWLLWVLFRSEKTGAAPAGGGGSSSE